MGAAGTGTEEAYLGPSSCRGTGRIPPMTHVGPLGGGRADHGAGKGFGMGILGWGTGSQKSRATGGIQLERAGAWGGRRFHRERGVWLGLPGQSRGRDIHRTPYQDGGPPGVTDQKFWVKYGVPGRIGGTGCQGLGDPADSRQLDERITKVWWDLGAQRERSGSHGLVGLGGLPGRAGVPPRERDGPGSAPLVRWLRAGN